MRIGARDRLRGFTFLGLLFIVALLAMTATMASVFWSTIQRRENERELKFAGSQFQAAIEAYRLRAKGDGPGYPRRLEDLLRDPRVPHVARDLRRIYVDPMTGTAEWGLLRLADGGIAGVYSRSTRATLKDNILGASGAAHESYSDWRFIAPSAIDMALDTRAIGAAQPASEALAAWRRPLTPAPAPRSSSSSPGRNAGASPQPVAGTEPDATAAEPQPETTRQVFVPRPSLDDYRTRGPEACDRIAAFDEKVCRDSGVRFGEDSASDCRESALKRNLACSLAEEGPLPPLVLRRN